MLFSKHGDLFSFKKRPFQTKSETYEQSLAKSVKIFQLKREKNWTDEDFLMAIRIINYDIGLGLHHTMFIPALERLATDEQKSKWLPLALSYQIIGTYAQTELGHGTNLLGLETTATLDPTTDEFVLNSPKLSSMKWWPGALGKSCTHAVVLAQLVINNNNHGMHPFMVQLRSLDDHTPMPGIKLGDIGPKIGGNNIDNGFLILNNYRIPRTNMLMRNAVVTKDGKFTQLSGNKANYATMILVRVQIVSWAFDQLRQASCVAVRYSAVRRQTTLKPGTPEQQILDYQTQQYKIFPALAASYAVYFISQMMMSLYQATHGEIMKGNTRKLAELHAQSSALKAFITDMSTNLVEVCRRSCGGHGFLMASGVAQNAVAGLALVTVEGENTVLYLQTARYLMKQIANALSGTKTEGSTAYMNKDATAYSCPLQSPEDCRDLNKLKEIYSQRALKIVLNAARKIQMDYESGGLPQEVVFNNNMVSLVRAAKAHAHLTSVDYTLNGLWQMRATCSPELASVITDLCCFFVIHGIVTESGDFLEMETLGLSQMEWLRQEELKLLAVIRPNAAALVDAYDLHDDTVASALGQYNGNAYQALYESTQYEPLNQTEVHPSYYKHLRDLIKGTAQSKL